MIRTRILRSTALLASILPVLVGCASTPALWRAGSAAKGPPVRSFYRGMQMHKLLISAIAICACATAQENPLSTAIKVEFAWRKT